MKRVGIFDAKTHFSQLVDDVARHRRGVIIEKRGRPMAVLGPYEETLARDEADRWAWIFRELDDILASQAPPKPGERVEDLIDEGR
jgi:prevent-host-death family protein